MKCLECIGKGMLETLGHFVNLLCGNVMDLDVAAYGWDEDEDEDEEEDDYELDENMDEELL